VQADPFIVVALLEVAPEAVDRFQRYEDAVLPLLTLHGGEVQRRLRSADGTTEVHVLSFPSEDAWRRYRDDPGRLAHRPLLAGVQLVQRVMEALIEVR
jgi:hypothetical protein